MVDEQYLRMLNSNLGTSFISQIYSSVRQKSIPAEDIIIL